MEENTIEEKNKDSVKFKKSTLWMISTVILAILLVVSIKTDGFSFGDTTGQAVASDSLKITVLNDERCEECDITRLSTQLKMLFPNSEIEEIDYGSKDGKKLFVDTGVEYLPAVFFTEDVKNDKSYSNIANFLFEAGDYLSLKIGAGFDPEAEICNNGIDDDGDKIIDCNDVDCKESLLCRPEIAKKLDLFVMSQCPFGTKALDAMEEVLENFKDDINFDVHFIATETSKGVFNALNGQPEVDENIRELCAIEHYPETYMNYIWCRNKNIMSAKWEGCAIDAFGTSDEIKECFEGDEGKELLSEDIKLANALNIGASPTWLANNQVKFSGVDAETVKENFCKANPGLSGCSNTLSGDTGVSGSC